MIIDSFADDTNRLLLLAGHYPRGGGVIALSGWRGQLWHTGPGQIVVSIQPQHSKTVFNLKLWFSQYQYDTADRRQSWMVPCLPAPLRDPTTDVEEPLPQRSAPQGSRARLHLHHESIRHSL
jgi:hypothetical protein